MVNAWGEAASLEFMNVDSFTQYEMAVLSAWRKRCCDWILGARHEHANKPPPLLSPVPRSTSCERQHMENSSTFGLHQLFALLNWWDRKHIYFWCTKKIGTSNAGSLKVECNCKRRVTYAQNEDEARKDFFLWKKWAFQYWWVLFPFYDIPL